MAATIPVRTTFHASFLAGLGFHTDGAVPARWARWDLATQVQLFPGPFGNDIRDYSEGVTMRCEKLPCDHGPCTETVPCGPSKVMLRVSAATCFSAPCFPVPARLNASRCQLFIYYVAGAHLISGGNLSIPEFLLDNPPSA